jgi:heme/copper-type cytochrome/quinol oxidase subunit 4
LNLLRFTILYTGFSIVLAGIAAGLQEIFPEANLLVDKFWVIFCFLAGITYIAYVTADLGIKRDPEVGVMAIMASIAVKMIFSMAFVLIYSQNRPQLGGIFLTNFFSLYLLFTCFEIYWLLRNLRHQNK